MVSSVSRNTVNRLLKDVREVVQDDSLHISGIYYEHDMDNFMNGHAMIVGPSDTPYEHGLFFFHFSYPDDYPYSPPKVKFLTKSCSQRCRVRINPNLYIDGKVCLSVLNTWNGEPWSACQTIRSILLTLITVLNEKPLMNEPGISEGNTDHLAYNRIVKYTSLYDCCLHMEGRLEKLADYENLFKEQIKSHIKENREKAEKALLNMRDEALLSKHFNDATQTETLTTRCYGMRVDIPWSFIKNK